MRVELKGDAKPNPIFALPDPGTESTLPPLVLNLPHGVPFIPQTYIDQGYTNYEVWCIGGAGGQGGDGGGSPFPPSYTMADRIDNFTFQLVWPYYFSSGVKHYHDPVLAEMHTWGGGGGGGGLHVVSGLLAVLPDSCPVVVGQAGASAPVGQISGPETYTPNPPYLGIESAVYDAPHRSFAAPAAGQDGGSSSFNAGTCRASGGKGGSPATTRLLDSEGGLMVNGVGGAGGVGNQTTAGGGAAGSTDSRNGLDGTWNGSIGKGGGGGRGGVMSEDPPSIPSGA